MVTSGAISGASGGPRIRLEAMPWIVGIAVAIAVVNVASHLIEFHRRGQPLSPWEPIVWELSSIALIIAMAPLIGLALARWPPRTDRIAPFVGVHLALTIPFSALHVGGFVALRHLAYALVGQRYAFSNGDLPLVMLYEWNKDALTYAALLATFAFFRWRADLAAARTPASPERIEIRDGASAIYLDPAAVAWVEAAGNYVEFHAGERTHLVRGTLQAWEQKLAPLGFARVHRSRLVNRARIRALAPTPAGDVAITLDDGRILAGSRRYRAALAGKD